MKSLSLVSKVRSVAAIVARRPLLAGGSVLGSVIVGVGIMVATPGVTSSADAASPSTYVPNIDDLLDARSPGARRYGWLLNTKAERVAFTDGNPIERVLPSVRRRLPYARTPGAVPLLDGPIIPDIGTEPYLPIGDSVLPGGGSGGYGTPSVGGILPGTGGSSSGGGGGTTPGSETPPPAVPEPTIWGMMILGFGVLGITLRRLRSAHLVLNL